MKVGILEVIYILVMFQLLVFSTFLFIRKTRNTSNYILGLQLFSQAAGIFSGFCSIQSNYFLQNNPHYFFAGFPFMFLWGPTFYLYVKSVAFSDFKFKPVWLVHFIPFFMVLVFLLVTFFPLTPEAKIKLMTSREYLVFKYSIYIDIFIRGHVLFYIFKSFKVLIDIKKKLKESFSSISVTNLAWLRFLVIGFVTAYFLSIIQIIVYVYILRAYTSHLILGVIVPYFIYFNIIYFKAWFQPEIFSGIEENVKYKSSKLTKSEAEILIDKLKNHMIKEKPYLNPDLTLNQLAEDLNLSYKVLSQIINEYFNQNFFDYINTLRIEESKKMLLEPSGKKTVLEVLYETGFNSKSTFNNTFKKMTGMTPTEFRKKSQQETIME